MDALVSLDTRKQLSSRMFLVGREEDMELGKQGMVYSLINKLIHKLSGYL